MKKWNQQAVENEILRIEQFIRDFVLDGEQVVVPVSGGLDSDLVARLCCRSIGKERIRLFIVIQNEMEEKFLVNARTLARDLDVPLAEIHLEHMNTELITALETSGEDRKVFCSKTLLDPAKAKCSVRSAVISCYQDKGFLIAGTTNKTEKELGFFLTFGDNLAHFKPIAHLYQSELKPFARALGTQKCVIQQEPSAGFWLGQTDLEDFAYWIINDGPIVFPRRFTDEEVGRAEEIKKELTYEKIDRVLDAYLCGKNLPEIQKDTGMSEEIMEGLIHIVEKAKRLKNRNILMEMKRES